MDIRHVNFMKIIEFRSKSRKIFFSKHLCGVATDYAIAALLNCAAACEDREESSELVLVVALCCHHLCHYESYNKEFLLQEGVTSIEFQTICKMSSWATCRFQRSKPSSAGEKNPVYTSVLFQNLYLTS